VLNHQLRLGFVAALHLVAAELVDELWRQSKVGTNRDAAFAECANGVCHPVRAFQLDHMGASAHKCCRTGHGIGGRAVTHERHVRHQ
jgi:hypothetical protein